MLRPTLALAILALPGCLPIEDKADSGSSSDEPSRGDPAEEVDADGDGFTVSEGDCDDSNATIHPAADELPDDDVDQDCNGEELCSVDADGDGQRSEVAPVSSPDLSCSEAGLWSSPDTAIDCNDADASVYTGAEELIGDEVDQDCDGTEICFADQDDDGHAVLDGTTIASADIDCDDAGEAEQSDPSDDCDDTDPTIHGGAAEVVADGIDQDCDGGDQCYVDADGDGQRSSTAPDATTDSSDLTCSDLGEATADAPTTDCDDTDPAIYDGAEELVADGIDQDCDGDELCYVDQDGDGHRPDATSVIASADLACDGAGEATSTAPADDCDDTDAGDHPGAIEIVDNGDDEDCDGYESCYEDYDEDGYRPTVATTRLSTDLVCTGPHEAPSSTPAADCDDTDASINPGATEAIGDEVDQDCDGQELCYDDDDSDGYLVDSPTYSASADADCTDTGEATNSAPSGDCDDTAASVNPGATESVDNGIDDDCDGFEACYEDGDDDGYLVSSPPLVDSTDLDCSDSHEGGTSTPSGDCDDADASIHPGATELVGDEVDQDCDGSETCYTDADSDGYRDNSGTTLVSADADCTDGLEALSSLPSGDCDDSDSDINPGATELYGGSVDEDCSGDIDDNAADPSVSWPSSVTSLARVERWTHASPGQYDFEGDLTTVASACDAFYYELNDATGTYNPVVEDPESHGWCTERSDGVLELVLPANPGAAISDLPSAPGNWNAGIYLRSRPWLQEESDATTCALVYRPSHLGATPPDFRSGRDCTPTYGAPGSDILGVHSLDSVPTGAWTWVCLEPGDTYLTDYASGSAASSWPTGSPQIEVPEGHPFCTGWGQMMSPGTGVDATMFVAAFAYATEPDSLELEVEVEGCDSDCLLWNNFNDAATWVDHEPDSVSGGVATFTFDTDDLTSLIQTMDWSTGDLGAYRDMAIEGALAPWDGWGVRASHNDAGAAGIYTPTTFRWTHGTDNGEAELDCSYISSSSYGSYSVDLWLGPSGTSGEGDWTGDCENHYTTAEVTLEVDGCDSSCRLAHSIFSVSVEEGDWLSDIAPDSVTSTGASWTIEASDISGALDSQRYFTVSGIGGDSGAYIVEGSSADWTTPGIYAEARWLSTVGTTTTTDTVDCTYIETTSSTGVFKTAVWVDENGVSAGGNVSASGCTVEY